MLITPSRSTFIKAQLFDTTSLFDCNPRRRARWCIVRAINRERRLLSKISKQFDLEEETAKRPVVSGKDAS